jgi:ABC-type transport system involved in multi-copper enzyme maturation permease subunit
VLREIVRFEWRYHTRQISFAAATLLFAGFGFVLTATGFGPANLNVNSPYSIAQSMGMASLAGVFVVAVFCASAVVRDRDYGFEEIVFSTAVEKFSYLFGRFAGSFLAATTAFSACAAGMLAALLTHRDRVGAVSLVPYAWTLFVLVVPSMLVIAVVLFAIATLTRSVLASVVGAVAIYVLYFVAAAFTNSPLMAAATPGARDSAAAALLDPFGLSAFFAQTRYWTPALRNTRLIALEGSFLANRLLWLAVAVAGWLTVYRRFSFRVVARSKPLGRGEADDAAPAVVGPLRATRAAISPSDRAAFPARLRLELRSFLGSIPFVLLTLLWFALAFALLIAEVTGGEYGSALYPSMGLLLSALQQPLALVGAVVIIYYSAEIVWRERATGIAEILSATPASSGAFVVAKWIALAVLTLVLMASGFAAAIAVQVVRGYVHPQPFVLLGFAWFAAVPLALLAAAAVFIQSVVPQKYAGMLATLALAIVAQAGDAFGLHPLLRPFGPPGVRYSEMNGFGDYAAPFHAFAALWAVLAAVALSWATVRWRPTKADRGRTSTRLIVAGCAFAVAGAAWIFHDTNIRHVYMSPRDLARWRAAYEKTYSGAATAPTPHVSAVTADVALFPKERRYRISGHDRLTNDSGRAIATMLVSLPREADVARLSVEGATLSNADRRFGTYTFRFDQPLPAGGNTSMSFDVRYDESGLRAGATDESIAENGSFIVGQRAFPRIGYRREYEIDDASERKTQGLPAREERSETDVALDAEWIDFDATVSTDRDQLAITSGRLLSDTVRGARRYLRYRSDGPIHDNFVFASARYAVATATAGAVKITVAYHPAHGANVDRILRAAQKSIALFERSYGPYPHRDLKIVEAASYWPFGGLAMPDTVFLSESRTFLIDARDPRRLDLLARRTAHEVAHQWWGQYVTPAERPGAAVIVESLAKYSELRLLEALYGPAAVQESLAQERDRYARGRVRDNLPEVPLARVTNQEYLYYGKGAMAMHAISNSLGVDRFDAVLREFVASQGGPAHHPTVDQLVEAMQRQATAPQRSLIARWMYSVN